MPKRQITNDETQPKINKYFKKTITDKVYDRNNNEIDLSSNFIIINDSINKDEEPNNLNNNNKLIDEAFIIDWNYYNSQDVIFKDNINVFYSIQKVKLYLYELENTHSLRFNTNFDFNLSFDEILILK